MEGGSTGTGVMTTSPVASFRRMATSLPSKRNSLGRRTAWLRPFLKSLAVLVADGAAACGLVFVSLTVGPPVRGLYRSIYQPETGDRPIEWTCAPFRIAAAWRG